MSFQRFGWRMEQSILLAIIILNVLDFFELLDPFWDYVKKIVSWVLIGYLLYRVSITDILFGLKRWWYDLLFVLAAFAMNVNDFLGYAAISRREMVIHAANYLAFVKQGAAASADVVVTNVTQAAWNTLTLIGVVPEAPSHLVTHATDITIANPTVTFLFERGAGSMVYTIMPVNVNGALLQWYNTILPYATSIELWGVMSGFIMLVLLAIFATARYPARSPSLITLLDREGEPRGFHGVLVRLMVVLLALVFFYLFVYTLFLEWLAIAIDAPLLMTGLSASVLLIVGGKRFDTAKWLEAIGNFGTEFYERFIKLFHTKKHVLLGVSGLLVLHVLTEIGNFLLPFVAPMRDGLYLSQLGAGHTNIFVLAGREFTGALVGDGALIVVALLNAVAWFFLLAIPGYIWYKIFRLRHEAHERHYPRFAPWVLGLFFSSLVTMLLIPMITIKKLAIPGLVGVDFITRAASGASTVRPIEAALIALAVFAVTYFLALFKNVRKWMIVGPLLASVILLGVYIFLFFLSSFQFYLYSAISAFATGWYVLGVAVVLFLIMTIIFYISGYLLFLYEIVRD